MFYKLLMHISSFDRKYVVTTLKMESQGSEFKPNRNVMK